MMTIEELNQLSEADANAIFMQCCTSSQWVDELIKLRPYANTQALVTTADNIWQGLSKNDYLEAFEGHPQIGDVSTLRAKYANTKALASGEQSSVNEASEQVLTELSSGNKAYLEKFGYIFIVCATGKSAAQMLALLQERMANDEETELKNAAEEQRKIFQLRIAKQFNFINPSE